MIRSELCCYSDAYILVSGTITMTGAGDDNEKRSDEKNKRAIFKNCAPVSNSINSINKIQIENAKYMWWCQCII